MMGLGGRGARTQLILRCSSWLCVVVMAALWFVLVVGVGIAPVASAAGDANASTCPNEGLPSFALYLPDCRAYEMVTPPYKQGYPIHTQVIAEDGSRMVGWSLGVFAGAVGAPQPRIGLGTEYELARTPAGWRPTALAPSNSQFQDASSWYTTSADLSKTLWSMPTAPVGQDDYYVRNSDGVFTHVGPLTSPSHGPTVGPAPPGSGPGLSLLLLFDGASSDLSHVLYDMHVTSEDAWPGDETIDFARNLFEYVGTGQSAPVMVAVTGGAGSTSLIGQCGVDAGGPQSQFHVISGDGDTVFFTPVGADVAECGRSQPAVDELFARLHGSETVALSVPSPAACTTVQCTGAVAADALFQGASRDGSKAFFASTQQLTDQASEDATPGDSAVQGPGTGCPEAHESGCNLYEYDFDRSSGDNLVLVSGGSASPHVQGVARISQDGSHVYFVAQGVLTSTPNRQGQTAQAGEDNLYVFERDAQFPNGRTSFIATVASSDEELWGRAEGGDGGRPAQTTPDGRFLVFQSHADLTSDDTSSGVWQVFEYDTETAELVRVSQGQNDFNDDGNTTIGSATIPVPFYVPGAGGHMPQPLALSDDGSYVYFQSSVGLTPQALNSLTIDERGNKANNVYEYHNGVVYLVSTGKDVSVSGDRSGSNVNLLGGSASGSDIFFTSGERIVSEDVDYQQDVYDARIDGGFVPQTPSASCSGEGCLGALSGTPSLLVSGSSSQPAGENVPPESGRSPAVVKPKTRAQIASERLAKALKSCRGKHNRKKRLACEAGVRKRYGAELHPSAKKSGVARGMPRSSPAGAGDDGS